MTNFVRKNLLVCTVTFADEDGSLTQPSTVTLFVNYRNAAGAQTTDELDMTYNSTNNNWSASWDSSLCVQGNVEWMVFGSGVLQASTQGQFQIVANAANVA